MNTVINTQPFVCQDREHAAKTAKRLADQHKRAYWFWESSAGFAWCGTLPDGVSHGNVRSVVMHEGANRVIVPPDAPG